MPASCPSRGQNAVARPLSAQTDNPHLEGVHWLPLPFHAQFKVMIMHSNVLHVLGPGYRRDCLTLHLTARSQRTSCQPPVRPTILLYLDSSSTYLPRLLPPTWPSLRINSASPARQASTRRNPLGSQVYRKWWCCYVGQLPSLAKDNDSN